MKNLLITAKPDYHKNLLNNWRQWFDENPDDELGDSPEEQTPSAPDEGNLTLEEQLVNFNALDDEGHRLYFDRDTVTKLRQESETRRKELREREAAVEKLQSEISQRKEAEEARRLQELQEQEQFKELASEWETKYTSLQQQLEAERINNIRLQVGQEFNLPQPLIDRLRGETLEDLRQDAESLAQLVAQEEPPAPRGQQQTTPVVPSGGESVGRTDQQRRDEYYGRYQSSSIFNADERNIRFAPTREVVKQE